MQLQMDKYTEQEQEYCSLLHMGAYPGSEKYCMLLNHGRFQNGISRN